MLCSLLGLLAVMMFYLYVDMFIYCVVRVNVLLWSPYPYFRSFTVIFSGILPQRLRWLDSSDGRLSDFALERFVFVNSHRE